MKRDIETLISDRTRLLGPNISTFYDDPVHIVRGEGVWLWDADSMIIVLLVGEGTGV